MKNMKVKKALMAMGAVMALGMSVQGHAQSTPAYDDAGELAAAKGADYQSANADLAAQCGSAPVSAKDVPDAVDLQTFCPAEDGRTYNADASGGAPV